MPVILTKNKKPVLNIMQTIYNYMSTSTNQNKRHGIGYKKSDSNGNNKAALIKKFNERGGNDGNGSTQGGATAMGNGGQ